MPSMATHTAAAFSISYIHNCKIRASPPSLLLPQSLTDRTPSYNSLVFQAARLLGPPARFEASKLKVSLMEEEEVRAPTRIVPRTYTLSHCDFTADLSLTISNIIQRDQLKGWYSKDDVVAEWTNVNGEVFLNVHCYVSGPNSLSAMTAEFRYLIFSKELPLVLEAVLYGDSEFFREHQELMDALVRVYFHSSSNKYNRMECWGPLATTSNNYGKNFYAPSVVVDSILSKGKGVEKINGYQYASKESSDTRKFWGIPKNLFQALVTFLL